MAHHPSSVISFLLSLEEKEKVVEGQMRYVLQLKMLILKIKNLFIFLYIIYQEDGAVKYSASVKIRIVVF